MVFNFAETFLRESGAAQDRSRSMAEMQLRAKQFADEMILKEADLAVRKRAQEFNEADQLFRQATEAEKLEIQRNVAEKTNELREIQMEISELELADLKKGNEFVTDEEAERYNVPKGTKRKDIASSLELRKIALQNELYESEVQDKLKEKELTRKAATAQQVYATRPQKSLEEAAESVKSGRFSALDTKSGFGRYAWNPAMNAISTALFGPASSYSENRILRNLETATGVKREPLIEAMMEKSSQGSIVSEMPSDIRDIYLPQLELNILRSNPNETNINTSTLIGPNFPMYGADYTNYIRMMRLQQQNVTPEE